MTDREKHIAQKKKELEKIAKQQIRLMTKVVTIVSKPAKRMDVNLRRIGKIMSITMQIKMLEARKQIIISQPIPKINGFLTGGPAVVGEDSSKEVIITNNGKLKIK